MPETGVFLAELGVLVIILGVLSAVAGRVGISPIPFFLFAGLAFGEGGLAEFGPSSAFVEATAEIGVLLLLLLLGLEFSPGEFMSSMRHHAPSGLVDFLLNAPPGFVVGLLLGFDWRVSLALAGITWISSSGIVARLIGELGRTGHRETRAILSVLVLEDVAMAAFLPLVAVLLAGGTPLRAALGVALAVTAVALIFTLARRYGGGLGRVLGPDDAEQVLLRVMGLTLLIAGLTSLVGASAAVGAFLVGLAIPGQTARRAREVLKPLRDLFAAIFFLSFGLATDTSAVVPALPAAAVLAVVTLFTKFATGWFAARRDGVGTYGRARAGLTLVPRGEFSIVIAGLAVTAGSTELRPLATAYVLLLGLAGPLLARESDRLTARVLAQGAQARAQRRPSASDK
jgi:CPA2 family monovalent cation:H+ antiporter-2